MEKINEIEISKRKYTIYKLNQEETTYQNNGYKIIPEKPFNECDGQIIPPNDIEKYYTVDIAGTSCKLHRIVYCAYTNFPYNTFGKQVHHINENKKCNKIENLIGLLQNEHFLYHELKRKAIEFAENKRFMEAQEFFYNARKILRSAIKREMNSTKESLGTPLRTELYLDKGFREFQEKNYASLIINSKTENKKIQPEDLINKNYKQIPFTQNYFINREGIIYNIEKQMVQRTRKLRNPEQTKNYSTVSMPGIYCRLKTKTGTIEVYEVAYLIGLLFLPNPNNKTKISFIDNDRYNISLDNLKWE